MLMLSLHAQIDVGSKEFHVTRMFFRCMMSVTVLTLFLQLTQRVFYLCVLFVCLSLMFSPKIWCIVCIFSVLKKNTRPLSVSPCYFRCEFKGSMIECFNFIKVTLMLAISICFYFVHFITHRCSLGSSFYFLISIYFLENYCRALESAWGEGSVVSALSLYSLSMFLLCCWLGWDALEIAFTLHSELYNWYSGCLLRVGKIFQFYESNWLIYYYTRVHGL